jgi:DNA modification methylase
MKIYSQNKDYKLYYGNMLDMLEVIEKNSIDSVICDPPYELNFMSKGWDNAGVSFKSDTWKKCYEVLKPGGYLLAFGGSRTFHRIACAIEDAGFEIRDTIMWLYGSGFPKSMDISKQIDKKGGNDYSKQFAIDLKQARESRNLTQKYCDDKYCNGSTNWSWYEGRKDGCRIPDYQTYLEIIKEFPELEKYRELIKEVEREVIGKGKAGLTKGTIANFAGTTEFNITAPSTNLAKKWQGWGTALKPSFEPIIIARKPFKGSLVDNVIEHGVGGINIDECRVGNEERFNPSATIGKNGVYNWNTTTNENEEYKGQIVNGRFPANTILTYDETDFDEVCGGFPKDNKGQSNARYFYCAKASKKDRDEGLEEFEDGNITDGRKAISDRPYLRKETSRKNTHPTVKPTELMQYLVRLVSPDGATILDPFNGSGSTGKAVMYENKERNKNYKYIGIELTEEYLPISKARIEYVCNFSKEQQMNIFNDFDLLSKESKENER